MKKTLISALICASLAISGCSSMGYSTYGSSPSAIASAKSDATSAAKNARGEVRALNKDLRKANRQLKRMERKLRRALKRNKRSKLVAKLQKQIKAQKSEVKALTRDLRKATLKADRAKSRVKNLEVRYQRAVELEKKRKLAAAESSSKPTGREGLSIASTGLFGDPSQQFIDDYNARNDGGFNLPAIPVNKINKKFLRQKVNYFTSHRPGTLIVNTRERHLYFVLPGGKAIRYGIGVGKSGFEWEGEANIAWKKAWPTWTPPEEMIARTPRLAKYSADNGGQPAGLTNPLGARALYIHKDGKDTLFRVHGTPKWASIGTAASSGCIRMMNQDVIDLYSRVRNGAKIIVQHS